MEAAATRESKRHAAGGSEVETSVLKIDTEDEIALWYDKSRMGVAR